MGLSRWRILGVGALVSLLVAGCASAGSTPKATSGGVVTWAEAPSSAPNYILPLESGTYFSTPNSTDFSQLMYLPLYWFGQNGEPVLNYSLSVGTAPVFSHENTIVTITLKHWMWSNGQPITARDVVFWMNLVSAATSPAAAFVGSNSSPGPGWGAAVPGGFPQNIVSYKVVSTYVVSLTLNASYNPTWFTYNELSQIYPLPTRSWDRLASNGPIGNYDSSAQARTAIPNTAPAQYQPAHPGTPTSGALGVAQFLNSESQNTSTYATNPLWKVVDGPFRLAQFTSSGFVKLVPNPAYSGPHKPTISAFEELPFTSDSAEITDLVSGALTIGYITPQSLAEKAQLESHGYAFSPWYDFAFQFMRYNFTNPTAGPIFRQLYFRQAFQSLVNQDQYIKVFLSGYGTVTEGPVPTYPPGNPDVSPLLKRGPVYPYDPNHAVALLKAHGWAVHPGGVSTCSNPGTGANQCGAGVAAGQALTFSVLYGSGVTSVQNEMIALQSAASQIAGISLHLSSVPFGQVVATMHGHCSFSHPCSDWQFANTGGGWVYDPDYYPTGGELYSVGAGANTGYYDSAVNQANIAATHSAPNAKAERSALFAYEDYLAKNLPMVWLPSTPFQLTMYKRTLHGVVPQGIFSEIYPQDYTFSG